MNDKPVEIKIEIVDEEESASDFAATNIISNDSAVRNRQRLFVVSRIETCERIYLNC